MCRVEHSKRVKLLVFDLALECRDVETALYDCIYVCTRPVR